MKLTAIIIQQTGVLKLYTELFTCVGYFYVHCTKCCNLIITQPTTCTYNTCKIYTKINGFQNNINTVL